MARVVISGYAIRHPGGGNIWAHLQYVVGLDRLGHEVWFIEGAGWEDSCYDHIRGEMTSDPSSGIAGVSRLLESFGIFDRVAYKELDGAWQGHDAPTVESIIEKSDLFVDLGGTTYLEEMHAARLKVYVDMDPVTSQFGEFGHGRFEDYDLLFTYGSNVGRDGCSIPTLGLTWLPLRPPIVLDAWNPPESLRAGRNWTTIAYWNPGRTFERNGVVYGSKDVEFLSLIDLPKHTDARLEIALSGSGVPSDEIKANGWILKDASATFDPLVYREYIWRSRGEFSVARNSVVSTNSGWFSDRTVAYLASGRPAVVQDTGIRDVPAEKGLFFFSTKDEALAAIEEVESNYLVHSEAARDLAENHFDAEIVLQRFLMMCGLE